MRNYFNTDIGVHYLRLAVQVYRPRSGTLDIYVFASDYFQILAFMGRFSDSYFLPSISIS